MEEEKRSYFTQLPDSWLYRKDVTVYDCRVMHALMSFCVEEGTHKVNMRQLANVANISLSILCTTDEQARKPKEGILDKFHAMGYITLIYARELDLITRKPKGQVQTYIRMNYTKIWQDNDTFFQSYRPVGLNSCFVKEDSFVEDPKRVRPTNTLDLQTNASVILTNSPDRHANKGVRHSSSNFTRYDPDTSRDSLDTKNDTKPSLLSPEELLIFQWCVEDAEYEPKMDAKNKEYCSKIDKKGITTRVQYNALRDVARSMIRGEDKTVYLGNMASVKTLNAWEKQSQQPEEEGYEVSPTARLLSQWTGMIAERYVENRMTTRKRLLPYLDTMIEQNIDYDAVILAALEQCTDIGAFFDEVREAVPMEVEV